MIVYPNAKINIGLNIVEKRPDGYHNLETVFYPINLLDALEITVADKQEKKCTIKVSGEILAGRPEDNLVVKAYNALKELFPDKVKPVEAHLHKHIPSGAGLGGGSSDAAFTLKLLNEKFQLDLSDEQLQKIAANIGADCSFFIKNKPVFAQGIGDVFTELDLSLKGKVIVLVKPDIGVSTKDAYAMINPKKPEFPLTELLKQPIEQWKDNVVNDFEKSVFRKYPEIAAIKDRLYDLDAIYAAMSGSGSAVFGIFNQQIEHVDEIFTGYFCRQRMVD
jgi:4-diphosphocytidyl-2-C-methyl-D-erythritol kinase